MLEFEDVCELIADYCDSCEVGGNCDGTGSCPKRKAFSDKMWAEYKAQFEEASE